MSIYGEEEPDQAAAPTSSEGSSFRTTANPPMVFILDQGRIVERGQHEDFLHKGGLYAKLCAGTGLLNES